MKFRTDSYSQMRSSKTFRCSQMPRPLTAESSEELKKPSSSQLAHEDEKGQHIQMIQLDDIKIEMEKKKDEEDEDYIQSSHESTNTEVTTDSMEEDNENDVGSDEGVTTPTAGSQNSDNEIMDETDVETEPQFQSSPASSQSTQHSSREHLTPEQMLLDRYDIIPRDIRAIKRFLEHNGYSRDRKKVAIAVGWRIDSEGLQLVKTWIAQCGDGVHD